MLECFLGEAKLKVLGVLRYVEVLNDAYEWSVLTDRPLGPALLSCMEEFRGTLRGVTGERQLPSRRLFRNGVLTVEIAMPKECDLERENPAIGTKEEGLRILIMQSTRPHWIAGKRFDQELITMQTIRLAIVV